MHTTHRVCVPEVSCLHSVSSCLDSALSCLDSTPSPKTRMNIDFSGRSLLSTFFLPYYYQVERVDNHIQHPFPLWQCRRFVEEIHLMTPKEKTAMRNTKISRVIMASLASTTVMRR